MKLIWQLLRQHVSVLQLAGFLVTNLVAWRSCLRPYSFTGM